MTGPGIVQHDSNGNLTASPGLGFIYNGLDQATSITASGNTVNMGYAGSGQAERTSVGTTTQVNGILGVQADTTSGVTTYYERDSRGTLVSERTPSGDFYYVFDGLGSVVGLVDPSGTHRAVYTYDPYGAQATATGLNGALPANPWRYAGGYLDSTGIYHFAARYYHPATGRWTQQDSVVLLGDPGNGNRYVYVADNPVNLVDPSGKNAVSDFFTKDVPEFFGSDCFASIAGLGASALGAGVAGVGFVSSAAHGNAVTAGISAVGYAYAIESADEYAENASKECN